MGFKTNIEGQEKSVNRKAGKRMNFLFTDEIPNEAFLVFKDNSEQVVRVLPPWSAEGLIMKTVEAFVYFPIGDEQYSFCAPSFFNMADPFTKVSKEIFDLGRDVWNTDAYKSDLKKVRSQKVHYANVLVPPDWNKVLLMKCPEDVKNDFLKYMKNPSYGDIADEENGIDFTITTVGSKKMRKYSAMPERNSRSILGNPCLDQLFNLDKIFAPPPVELFVKAFVSIDFTKYIVSNSVKRMLRGEYGIDYDEARARVKAELGAPQDTNPADFDRSELVDGQLELPNGVPVSEVSAESAPLPEVRGNADREANVKARLQEARMRKLQQEQAAAGKDDSDVPF